MHVIDKLSVSGSGIHGITKAFERWIPRFDPREFHFSVCSLRAPESAGEILERNGIAVFFLSRSKFDPRTLTSLLALIRQEKPSILHLHGYGASNFGRVASVLTGLPNIVHEHSVLPKQPLYQTLADAILAPITTKALACSEPVREFMFHKRKLRKENVETLFYGIPLDEIPKLDEIEGTRKELGILTGQPVVCTVGRLDTQKGQMYLLKAAVSILKEIPDARFIIVGEGPDLKKLKSIAQRDNILDKVIFTGLRDDVSCLLALSDVVAIPSLWEGGPLTLFEAMNMRRAVVGTPAGMMNQVIRDGENGFIVPFKNAELLAEKIITLLKNPLLANAMGERGWQICQQYSISVAVERLAKLYKQMAFEFRTIKLGDANLRSSM
jgi:glycosyltransferase involved in cell wall biosynthesis